MIVPMPPAFDLLAEPPSGVFHYGQSSWGAKSPWDTFHRMYDYGGEQKKKSDKWIKSGCSENYISTGYSKEK